MKKAIHFLIFFALARARSREISFAADTEHGSAKNILVYLQSCCPHSLMDRIQDSGSYDCSSILHGGTKKEEAP